MGGLFDEVQNMARLRQIELFAGVLNENDNKILHFELIKILLFSDLYIVG